MFREAVVTQKGKNQLAITKGNVSLGRAWGELLLLFWLIIFLVYYSFTYTTQAASLATGLMVVGLLVYACRVAYLFSSGVSILLDREKMTLTIETFASGKRSKESFAIEPGSELELRYTAETMHLVHSVGVRMLWSLLVPREGALPFRFDFSREKCARQCAGEAARFLGVPLRDTRGAGERVLQPGEIGVPLVKKQDEYDRDDDPEIPPPPRVRETRTKEGVTFLLPPLGYRTGLGILLLLNHGLLLACLVGITLSGPHSTLSEVAGRFFPLLLLLSPLGIMNLWGIVALLCRAGISIDRRAVRRFHLFAGIRYAKQEMPLAEVLNVTRERFHGLVCDTLTIEGEEQIIKVRGNLAPEEQDLLRCAVERAIRNYGKKQGVVEPGAVKYLSGAALRRALPSSADSARKPPGRQVRPAPRRSRRRASLHRATFPRRPLRAGGSRGRPRSPGRGG